MTSVMAWVRGAVSVCCALFAWSFHGQAIIPAVHAESLAGNVVTLPDSAAKNPTLLVLGFSQKTSEDAKAWVKRAGAAIPEQRLAVYTLPVLVEAPRFVRGLILRSMRKDTPAAVQMHFVPIYDHEDEWKRAAQFDKPDEVYVLLVDAQGRVRWRVEGAVTEARLAELAAQLKSLGG